MTTKMNNTPIIDQCTQKIVISSIYTAIQPLNIVVNIFITHRLTKIYKNAVINKSFYSFLTNLLISDVAYFAVYFVGCLPQVFTCDGPLGNNATIILGFCNTWTFVSLSTNILLISLNRYFAICWPNANNAVFPNWLILYYCIGAWFFGPLLMLFNYLIGCYSNFNEDNPTFGLRCSSPNTVTSLSPVSIYLYICAYGLFVFYAMCIRKLKSHAVGTVMDSVTASINHKQMLVFWQSLFIWLSFVASITSYRVVPSVTNTYAKFIINITFSFGCLYSTPIIVVCFSKKLRSDIVQLFSKNHVNVVVAHVHMN